MVNRCSAVALILTFLIGPAFAAKKGPQSMLFGPTGIMGTPSKNAIAVAGAQPGSPAEGKLNKGDQIVGVGGKKFTNPKRDMAAAIDVAETKEAGGKMTLMLKGNKEIVITLAVLGTYSKTAPYDCPKSNAIIKNAAESLLKGKQGSRLHPELLGLMATGEKKYIDAATKVIQGASWTKPDPAKVNAVLAGEADAGYVTWSWGYHLITMAEYYLLTKDDSVLPGIKTYAMAMAKGQDAGGMYGHRLTSPKRNYRLPGYAQMNQPSLTCFMSMILAKKCGIKDSVLLGAIAKTNAYVGTHINAGGFPYGVHGPNSRTFNNNGTSGSAALCRALLDDSKGASFFSRMAATSYDGLEHGHASTFFNPWWTALGANVSGPEVTQQFFRKSLWFYNMRRNFDGSFSGDGKEGPQEGVALLAYCLPRKALYITGKGADESIWLKGQAATDAIMLSKIDYKSKSDKELMAMAMKHDMPQVRRFASATFGQRREKLTPTWIKYLKEGTPEQKKLAIGQYGWWIPIEVRLPHMEAIGAILRNPEEPLDVRAAAAGSLAYMKESAQKFYPDMVKLLAVDKPDDPFLLTDMGLGRSLNILCADPFKANLIPDKKLHYKAALKLVRHKRQHGRAEGLRMLAGIPLEDFHLVADDVLHVIKDKDPTYHSYHSPGGPVVAGITILANLNIKEGIPMAMAIMDMPSGKHSFKMKARWACLAKYGANAKPQMLELKKAIENNGRGGMKALGRHRGAWNAMEKAVMSDKNPKNLISLEEAIAAGKK